jgi:hypothetical protein
MWRRPFAAIVAASRAKQSPIRAAQRERLARFAMPSGRNSLAALSFGRAMTQSGLSTKMQSCGLDRPQAQQSFGFGAARA